jgi:site-specific DNA-methyltransferase (adenine-specific)
MHKDTLEAQSPNEPLNPLLRVGAVIGCPSSELYNMDCVQGMKHYPDNYFDLAICDPPYGIGLVKTENGSWGIRKPESAENASKTFDWDFAKPTKEYIVELFRVSKNQILFGANHYIEVVPYNSPCWLVWDKVNGDSYFADCELAWTSFETATRKIKLQYFGANSHRFGKRIHPTQKPVGLYEYILENYAKQGERILDTHVGSGSSRIACHFKGFDFVGFEIDKEMAEKSDKRFHDEISQQRLF